MKCTACKNAFHGHHHYGVRRITCPACLNSGRVDNMDLALATMHWMKIRGKGWSERRARGHLALALITEGMVSLERVVTDSEMFIDELTSEADPVPVVDFDPRHLVEAMNPSGAFRNGVLLHAFGLTFINDGKYSGTEEISEMMELARCVGRFLENFQFDGKRNRSAWKTFVGTVVPGAAWLCR